MNTLDCKTKNDILLYMISNLRYVAGKVASIRVSTKYANLTSLV